MKEVLWQNRRFSGYRYDMETCWSLQRNGKGDWIPVFVPSQCHLNSMFEHFSWFLLMDGRREKIYTSFEALAAAKHSMSVNYMGTSNDPPGSLTHDYCVFSWIQVYTNCWGWTQEVPSGFISRNSWELLSSVVLKVAYLGLWSFNKPHNISGP